MGALIDRLKDWWSNADQTQKLVTGFGLAFLTIILGFTVFFATKPQMLPVFVGLNDSDKSAVYDELAKAGFKVDLQGPAGEVVVPAQDVARAKMVLASKNKLPKGSGGSMDIINNIAIGDSAAKEREKILASKEKELEDSIGTMDNVAAAQVHLNLGKDSPFAAEEALPSASVRITEDSDGSVTSDQGKSIARLVEFAITNLKSSEISVVANSGRMIFDGKDEDNPSSIANNKLLAEEQESKRRQRELQAQLDKVFGPGNTIVDVAVTLNMDAIAIQENKTVGEDTPLVKQTTSETYTGSANTVGGVAGVESNNGANGVAAQSGKDGKSAYGNEATSTQYPSTNTKTSTQKAAGELTTMNILVMANKDKLDADAITALDAHVKQYIAPYSDKPGFTTSITPVAFNTDTSKIQEKAAQDAASSQRMQQLISILPVGALLLVGAILMRSLTKTLKGQTVQTLVLANGQTVAIPTGASPELINMIESASATNQALEHGDLDALAAHYDEEEIEEDTGEVDEAGEPITVKRKKRKRIIEDDDDEDDVPVGSIKRRIDVPLEQIKKMSKKNPEAVAMLVKGWVMEERN